MQGNPPKFARHTAVTINEKVYLFGGFDGVSQHFHLSVFDASSLVWTNLKPLGHILLAFNLQFHLRLYYMI